jgi:hypothetical protein
MQYGFVDTAGREQVPFPTEMLSQALVAFALRFFRVRSELESIASLTQSHVISRRSATGPDP